MEAELTHGIGGTADNCCVPCWSHLPHNVGQVVLSTDLVGFCSQTGSKSGESNKAATALAPPTHLGISSRCRSAPPPVLQDTTDPQRRVRSRPWSSAGPRPRSFWSRLTTSTRAATSRSLSINTEAGFQHINLTSDQDPGSCQLRSEVRGQQLVKSSEKWQNA